METMNFVPILYKNKPECKRAWLIDSRQYRWELKRKYKPCWVKNGTFVSVLSQHRRNFKIYVPAKDVKAEMEYTIQNFSQRVKIKVVSVNKTSFDYEVLERDISPRIKSETKELAELAGF